MTNKTKKKIERTDWVSNFALIGRAKVNDYTYKINEYSEGSDWYYNSLNLGVDCGEKFGTIYTECMGGYRGKGNSIIYVHGKNDDGTDDFSTNFEVAWEDRFDEQILDTVGNMCFFTVGLETTDKGKVFYKKFLSEYDAIEYIKEHLTEDTIINVKGNIKYSIYNDNTQMRRVIKSIVLSKIDDPSKFRASFTQSILINKDSVSLKNVDKDKGVVYVNATVLDYIKEYNGVEVRGQFPFNKEFEFAMDLSNQALCQKIMNKLFKVKKGYTQMTMEGDFIESGATVMTTLDDIPDDIKELIEIALYTEEEALAICSANGSKEQRMVLRKPYIKIVGEDKTAIIQIFNERYSDEDLYLDYLYENQTNNADDIAETDDTDKKEAGNDTSDMDWLNSL